MKYLAKYNEEVKWFKKLTKAIKGFNKKDMFISENFPGPTVADITPDVLMSGLRVPDNSLYLLKDYYIKDISNKGVFLSEEGSYKKKYKFKSSFDISSEVWYNQSHIFKRLKDISNQLGYKVGTYVYAENGASGVITEIIKFTFYDVGNEYCSEVLTLLYKVGDIYYQITQIEKSNEYADNIVDEVIKENFYELIDDNIISYSSVDEGNFFKCSIVINKFSMSRLNQVTEQLSIAEMRLKDSNISLEIENIYKNDGEEYTINFKCFRVKKR
jgi:hypothetical protein